MQSVQDVLAKEVLTFGKHKGKTIDEIRRTNPDYLYYLHDSEFYNKSLPKLDQPVLSFGKYKGKTYKSVAAEDPHYFLWLKKSATNVYTKAMIAFATGKPLPKLASHDNSIDSLEIS